MSKLENLHDPWLVAVWPGMGNVALAAGSYLVEQLGARLAGELTARDHFEVEHVEIKNGVATAGRAPRSMVFIWRDPHRKHDLVIFVGEAQPASGGYAFCHKLLDYAVARGVKRFYTFAAMATRLNAGSDPRVFGVATARKFLADMQHHEVEILEDGQISGLNGVLLAAGAERGLEGICLLGELPIFAVGVPNPQASQAVLEVFIKLAGIDLDFSKIVRQSDAMEERLRELQAATEEEGFTVPEYAANQEHQETEAIDEKTRLRIEALFERARKDRSRALELKQELDRLGVFKTYEDRFLDLFKKAQ